MGRDALWATKANYMEYYTAMKKEQTPDASNPMVNLTCIAVSERSQTPNRTHCIILFNTLESRENKTLVLGICTWVAEPFRKDKKGNDYLKSQRYGYLGRWEEL